MIRTFFVLALVCAAVSAQTPPPTQAPKPAAPAPRPSMSQIDASESLFTVLAAIHAAGFDADTASAANHPLRMAMREHLASANLKSVAALQEFFGRKRQRDAASELSQYISYALLLNGPPDFALGSLTESLPPDVAELRGLSPLLAAFYSEANVARIWRRVQPLYEQVIAQYQEPLTRAIVESNAYLRMPTSGYNDRRFQIFVELLGPPNQIHSRIYGGDYFVVVTPVSDPLWQSLREPYTAYLRDVLRENPDAARQAPAIAELFRKAVEGGTAMPELPVHEIRQSYLTYLLDPLPLRHSEALRKKNSLMQFAQRAPALDLAYKNDFTLLATKSLVRAVESRLVRGAANKQAVIDEAMREGFVLTAAFAEQLPAYEKQERAMRLYFPDMVAAIDVKKEEQRLAGITFAEQKAVRAVRVTPAEVAPKAPSSPAAKTLEAAEEKYDSRDLTAAKEGYLRVVQQTADRILQARAYYGLARIAALEKDPELSERLFQKTLELNPDPAVKSWSLLYLGRLAGARGDRVQAAAFFESALGVPGLPDQVRNLAAKGLEEMRKQE